MIIVSQKNPRIKNVRRLQSSKRFRRQEQAFVAEGTRWLSEILKSGNDLHLVLYTEDWRASRDHEELLRRVSAEALEVSPDVMASISELETSGGVLTVLPIAEKELPEKPTTLLIADGVADPGNLGAMLRTAAAAGIDGVILAPGCVDAYNPKVVRGGMGAHLHVAIRHLRWPYIKSLTSQMTNWIADSGEHTSYDQVDWTGPSSLIVGSEALGASETAREMFGNRVAIPMAGEVESLNVAVASGIILFEAVRQRSTRGKVK